MNNTEGDLPSEIRRQRCSRNGTFYSPWNSRKSRNDRFASLVCPRFAMPNGTSIPRPHERTFWQTGCQPRHLVTTCRDGTSIFFPDGRRVSFRSGEPRAIRKRGLGQHLGPLGANAHSIIPPPRPLALLNVKLTGERQTVRGGKYV